MPFGTDKPIKKSALSIRLTESAVYLRTDGPSGRPHRNAETRNSVVRGLLVLELAKPTKIESVELELVATTATAWPEGVGARRVEVSEQHQVFHASTVYFKADASVPSRRATSIGPGTTLNLDDPTLDWDLDDLEDGQIPQDAAHTRQPQQPPADTMNRPQRAVRRVSVDSHIYHRLPPVSHSVQHDDDIPPYSPVDPASPMLLSPMLSPSLERSQHHRPTLEELRSELNSSLQNFNSSRASSALSLRSYPDRSLSRVPSNNMDALPEDDDPATTQPTRHASPAPPPRSGSSLSRVHEEHPPPPQTPSGSGTPSRAPSISTSLAPSDPPSDHTNPSSPRIPPPQESSSFFASSHREIFTSPPLPTAPGPPPPPPSIRRQGSTSVERRGRNRSRFSLTAVADAFREAVRSTSPVALRFAGKASKERGGDRSVGRGDDWVQRAGSRGRTMERGVSFDLDEEAVGAGPSSEVVPGPSRPWEPTVFALPGSHRTTPRNRDPIPRIFSGIDEVKERRDQKKTSGSGWKEFKKGTYTYPISFSIPSTAPPSLQTDYGSVTWKLHAHVHRPGAFKSKYTATREVTVVACPTEEDTEESENIIVERHWDGQLQYLISVSGRCFWIGGVVPVTFAFMPLMKIKIHRLSVWVEEKVDYYSNMRRVVRSDTTQRFLLLSIKHEGKHPPAILPIETDDPNALTHSPLQPLLDPDDDLSEIASSLMGPGPWTFHKDLQLPESCNKVHFTNKNRRANITVTHNLKVVIRVERGDDAFVDKHGKRKLFDIVVQTPVHILSCRCNPEWASLPRYEETFSSSANDVVLPNCPCQVRDIVNRSGRATPITTVAPTPQLNGNSEIHIGPLHTHIPLPAPLERIMSHRSSTESNPGDHVYAAAYDPSQPGLHHSLSEPTHPTHPHPRSHAHLTHSPSPSPVRHNGSIGNHHHNTSHSASPHPAIPVHAHETSPLDHSMRSLRLHATTPMGAGLNVGVGLGVGAGETEALRERARQFGRLVAGYEGEFNGEAPPEYEVAVAQGVGLVGGSGVEVGGGEAERGRQRERGPAIQVN